ncbi:MAG: DUF4926 domain-containing protein [Nocardiaceae bacterium]|nr:DUF4926 domain-containing protein [Nocardiaceae bacterium]
MYAEHDLVVLTRDLPTNGLHTGDVGAVVGIYESGGYEVEFVSVNGCICSVVPLSSNDIRPGNDQEYAFYANPENQTPQGQAHRR